CLAGRLLRRISRLASHLMRRLLRRLLSRLLADLLANLLCGLCRLLHDLLRGLLRNRESNRARQLVANPAQRGPELRNANASTEAYPCRLRYLSERAAEPPLTELLRLQISERVEVPVLAALQPRQLWIAKLAGKTSTDWLTHLAKNVPEPTRRHEL